MTPSIKLISLLFTLNNCGLYLVSGNDARKNTLDMRTSCTNNTVRDVHLPLGLGREDSIVVVVSFKVVPPRCSLNFHTFPDHDASMIFVLEFADEGRMPCNNSILIAQDDRRIDICGRSTTNTITYHLVASNASVFLNGQLEDALDDIRITVTAARAVESSVRCNESDSVTCVLGNETLCISKELLCDGNINCGERHKYDEDTATCNAKKHFWLVVLCSMVMGSIVLFFCMRFMKRCLPTVPQDFFVFSSDGTETLVLTPQMKPPKRQVSPAWPNKSMLVSFEEGLDEDSRETGGRHGNFGRRPQITESSLEVDGMSTQKLDSIPDREYRLRNLLKTSWLVSERTPLPVAPDLSEKIKLKMHSTKDSSQQPLRVTYYTSILKL